MVPVTKLDEGSTTLYQISLMWNARKQESHSFYWAHSPDQVNTKACALWQSYALRGALHAPLDDPMANLDCKTNIDGAETKPGETYHSFAVIDHGSTSLAIDVEKVSSDTVFVLGANTIKSILGSCGLSKKGKTPELQTRLKEMLERW